MRQKTVESSYSLRGNRRTKFNLDGQPEKKKKIRKLRARRPTPVSVKSLPSCATTEVDESFDSDHKKLTDLKLSPPSSFLEDSHVFEPVKLQESIQDPLFQPDLLEDPRSHMTLF